jgi:uncharacterized protein with HEPN domain
MARPLPLIVEEILDYIGQVYEFTAGMTHDAFASDTKTKRAVERCLEVISEASRHIPDEIKDKHPQIEWRKVADSGNVFRHVYHSVAADIVWDTVKFHLPHLEMIIREIQAGLPDDQDLKE